MNAGSTKRPRAAAYATAECAGQREKKAQIMTMLGDAKDKDHKDINKDTGTAQILTMLGDAKDKDHKDINKHAQKDEDDDASSLIRSPASQQDRITVRGASFSLVILVILTHAYARTLAPVAIDGPPQHPGPAC
jgi:hypothetical protein